MPTGELFGGDARRFEETGFFICEGLVSPGDLASIRGAIQDIVDMQASRAGLPDGLSVMDLPPEYRPGVYDAVNSHPEVYRLAGQPGIAERADRLINGERTGRLLVSGLQLRMDLPGNESELLGWHRDHDYFQDLPRNGVVLWLPLVDIDEETGGISLVPTPARGLEAAEIVKHWPGRKPHRVFEVAAVETLPDPVRIKCRAGDGVFFSLFNPHRSEPNRSDKVRWTLQYRYFSASEAAENRMSRATLERVG